MGTDIGAKLDEIINTLENFNPVSLTITGSFIFSKGVNAGDDSCTYNIQTPDGYKISKLIYTTSGFSTDAYYTITVGGTSITSGQARSNVLNQEANLSSISDPTNMSLFIRRFGEASTGAKNINYTITLEKI